MSVVRHEAVRNDFNPALVSGTRQLHRRHSYGWLPVEGVNASERADREEIPIETQVLETSYARWWFSRHSGQHGNRRACQARTIHAKIVGPTLRSAPPHIDFVGGR